MSRFYTFIFVCYLFFMTGKTFAACPQFLGEYFCSSTTSDKMSPYHSLVKVTNLTNEDPFYFGYEIQDSDLSNGPLNLFVPDSDSNQALNLNPVNLPIGGAYCTPLNSLVVSASDSHGAILEYIPFDQSLWIKMYQPDNFPNHLSPTGEYQEVSIKKCILIPITSPNLGMPLRSVSQPEIDLPTPQTSLDHRSETESKLESSHRFKRSLPHETCPPSKRSRNLLPTTAPPLLQLPIQPSEIPYPGINIKIQSPTPFMKMELVHDFDSIAFDWSDNRSKSIFESQKEKSEPAENEIPSIKMDRFCKICKKSFRCQSAFKRHYRIHTGEKPFACNWPECSFQSNEPSNLRRHRQTHSNERPFHCNINGCQAAYTRKAHLQNHQKKPHKRYPNKRSSRRN